MKIIKKIKRLARQEGRDWNYMTDLQFRFDLFFRPGRIFDPADSSEMRLAKAELVKHCSCVLRLTLTVMMTFVLAIILAAASTAVEYWLRRPN